MDKMKFAIFVSCPWCDKGGTFADKPAEINVSCQCNNCRKYYHVDFNRLRAIRAGPTSSVANLQTYSTKQNTTS